MSLSVIIPCYNAEPFLAEAIESVLSQTRPADEVLVVDDASTDGSLDVAKRYPVRIVRMPENRGHAAARNAGIRESQGRLLAWLDADDLWRPDHLETVAALLDAHPAAAVAFSGMLGIGDRSFRWTNSPCHDEPRSVFWESFQKTLVPASTALTRKAAMAEVGGYDESIRVAPDFEFWLRLAQRRPFVSTPKITSLYRIHPRQISAGRVTQVDSLYTTRLKFLENARSTGDEDLAARCEAELFAVWNRNLTQAWHDGARDEMRYLLSLAPRIPGGADAVRRWQLRSLVPNCLVRGMATCTRPFRKALRAMRAS